MKLLELEANQRINLPPLVKGDRSNQRLSFPEQQFKTHLISNNQTHGNKHQKRDIARIVLT